MKKYKVMISLNLSNEDIEKIRQEVQADRKNLVKLKYQYGYSVAVNHVTETITVSN